MRKLITYAATIFLLLNIAYAQTETEQSALKKGKDFELDDDLESALKWYLKANKLNPKNGTTYYDIAWCQNELGKHEDVLNTAEKGIAVSPSSKLYSEYGYALFKLDQYDRSIEKYKKALALDPEDNGTIKGIADAFYSSKDYDNALVYYKKTLTIDKNNKIANYKIAWIMNDHKNYQKAVEYSLAAILLDDKYAEAYNELGYAYSQLKQKDLALENYQKARDLKPENSTYNFNVADVYYTEGPQKDYDKAIIYYKKGIETEKDNAVSNYRLGWILNEKERYEEAQPYLYKAVEADPKYSSAWLELGWIDFSQKNYSAAESKFIKAIQYDSKTELARYYLGQVYIMQEKPDNARKMVQELKGMNSDYADKLKAKL